jgi:hypothetical protein
MVQGAETWCDAQHSLFSLKFQPHMHEPQRYRRNGVSLILGTDTKRLLTSSTSEYPLQITMGVKAKLYLTVGEVEGNGI